MRRIAASLLPVVFAFAGCSARAQGDTPTSLARPFVTGVHAPQKAFIPIAAGGHFAVFIKSREFLGQLVSRVRPLATH
jgi:hypothetical protein